jgi:osmoprotectant transport system ATP-binding protein
VITIDRVVKRYGTQVAVDHLSLEIKSGETVILVGPSGCGKTTSLKMINRLIEPTEGAIRIDDRDTRTYDVNDLRRSIGYVIQQVGLFPHQTVADNIATVPRLLGWPKDKIEARVEAMLDLVHLGGAAFKDRFPAELSGGQAQRVGLARALAADPDILLMDEPFGAVDPIIRRDLRAELQRIHAQTEKAIVLVTHDPIEALELATQIVVLRHGRIVGEGSPMDLTSPDGDPFVRDLFGGEALALRRLRFTTVADVREPKVDPHAPPIAPQASLREALARMVEARASHLSVTAEDGRPLGSLPIEALVERHR